MQSDSLSALSLAPFWLKMAPWPRLRACASVCAQHIALGGGTTKAARCVRVTHRRRAPLTTATTCAGMDVYGASLRYNVLVHTDLLLTPTACRTRNPDGTVDADISDFTSRL